MRQCPNCGYQLLPSETECPKCRGTAASPAAAAPSAGPPPPRSRISGLAIASLVVGILSLCGGLFSVVGLVLGIVALVRIGRSRGELTGQGLAIAGTALSGVGLVVGLVTLAILFPVFERAREAGRKATCIANVKQLALASLMYATDYDDILPTCVASDSEGTAHAVGGVYANWRRDDFLNDVESKYGAEYADGRWMWQLGDLLAPYVRNPEDLFNCPTLVRRDSRFKFETYIVGTDKRTGKDDPDDPLRAYIPGADKRKVWQSGSYIYMCAHHPYGRGVAATGYGTAYGSYPGISLFALWDAANLLGLIGEAQTLDAVNPQDYLACSASLASFDRPTDEPLLACNSLGVHEGYTADYINAHVVPPDLAPLLGVNPRGRAPVIPVATPIAFVDGHVKYYRADFQDLLSLLFSRNTAERR